jgi:hypothetical protein
MKRAKENSNQKINLAWMLIGMPVIVFTIAGTI